MSRLSCIPSNSDLIALWERGTGEHPVNRALMLLAACSPSESQDELARLSIGTRDARLIEIYERLFGPSLDAFAHCPACNEPLEYMLSTQELTASAASAAPLSPLTLDAGRISLRLRLPDSLDLRAVSACTEPELAAKMLTERCIVEATRGGQPVPPADLPPGINQTISSALAAADPGAEMLIDLNCAVCCHPWQVTLDIERFLWSKISATAKRLLRDVHALASAYGWREPDILALSTVRRQTYLEMAWPTF
jgi:hypothetical protein